MEGVQSGGELRLQRLIDRPVSRQPGEPGKGRRPDANRIMCFSPGGGASVPMVKMGLVHYIQLRRRKSSGKCSPDALCAACQFLRH